MVIMLFNIFTDSVCQNITIEKTRLHYIAHGTYTRLSNVTCYGRAVYVMIWPSAQTYYLYYLEVNTLSLWALGQTVCGDNVIMYRISSLTPHIQAASEWQEYIVVTNGFEAVSDVSISCQSKSPANTIHSANVGLMLGRRL